MPGNNNNDNDSSNGGDSSSQREKRSHPEEHNPLADRQVKKKRKKRKTFACAECRRLKMGCDRLVPCSNCVRRRCSSLCPDYVQGQDGFRLLSDASNRVLEDNESPEPQSTVDQEVDATDTTTDIPLEAPQGPSRTEPRPAPMTIPTTRLSLEVSTSPTAPVQHSQQGFSTITEPSFAFFETGSWSSVSPAQSQPQQPAHDELPSSGTLLMANGGRSTYLGPNASSEWLRDQETKDPDHTPALSRANSPSRDAGLNPSFPFVAPVPTTTEYLLSQLPSIDEAKAYTDAYSRYFAWQYDVVPRQYFDPLLARTYATVNGAKEGTPVQPHELGLLYMVFAMGALYRLELPPNDPIATEFLVLSKAALVKSNFLVHNTIHCVQTLHIMAHFHLESEEGRNGETSWPLWGLAMRISQAMGLHRDPSSWGLPTEVVEERRHVFWECMAADYFQANCFSRPCSISPDYVDTEFPKELSSISVDGRGYFTLKWELAMICGEVLDLSMKIRKPPDSSVESLHRKLSGFERSMPFPLRCRSALLSLPSIYADSESAIKDSPDVHRRDVHRTFQQCTLAVNVSEAFLFLHRPHFVKALREQTEDLTKSVYGQSFFSVMERCNVMVVVAATVHSLFPAIACRHWFFWHHAFNSAVTMGTLIIRNPQNLMAQAALTLIDSTILLLTRVIVSWPSPRMAKNLQWLNRLRGRAVAKLSAVTANPPVASQETNGATSSDDEDVELVGWRTRLVERAASGSQTVRTILAKSAPSPNVFSMPDADLTRILDSVLHPSAGMPPIGPSPTQTEPSTDTLLHQFWDPIFSMMGPSETAGAVQNVNQLSWWEVDPDLNIGPA